MGETISARLQAAIDWATELHDGQFRDGDDPAPYIEHPLDVMRKLRDVGGIDDEDLLVTAVLHDTIEECGITKAQIAERFGQRVAGLVQELTRPEPTEKEIAGLDKDEVYALRSQLLLRSVLVMSPVAQRVKLADRLSNLEEALRTRTGKKRERYLKQSHQLLEAIPKAVNPALHTAIKKLLKENA